MHKKIFVLGAISGMLAVALGAFGAHLLKKYLPPAEMAIYQTAVEYHFYHTAGLFIAGFLYKFYRHQNFKWAAWFFGLGILLFSGSLYFLQLFKTSSSPTPRWLGGVTPFGGVCFMLGWGIIASYFLFDKSQKSRSDS
jgi:uncharacterized membrane protein YgdD (TMEM256/DUF423 family)